VTGLPAIDDRATAAIELSLLAVDIEQISKWKSEWQYLEGQSTNPSVYTAYDWVHAWAEVYQPRRLLIARAVKVDNGAPAGIGLIEIDRIRGWRFAGGELSARRAPVCAAGCEDGVWHGLASWLRRHPRAWSTLEAWEVGESAGAVPGAHLEMRESFCLSTPDSLDSYFALLPSRHRSEMRRRLRRGEQAGITVREVPVGDRQDAIRDFIRLHQLRADAKSEVHTTIDERLEAMLTKVLPSNSIELYLYEICHEDARVAVDVKFAYRGVGYPYNLGWEPDVAHLGPGIHLAINGVSDAIARSLHTIDLGAGDQRYKRVLGFAPNPQFLLYATNPATAARAMQALGSAYQRLRGRSERPAASREAIDPA
jgi:CelD/BcsL family acetyltransferase involved in cellulose biosynthesis